MIINGVTLPDIPENFLAQYPYAVIFKATYNPDEEIKYALCVSETPMLFMPPEIVGQTSGSDGVVYNAYAYRSWYDSESATWGELTIFENSYTDYEGQMGVAVGTFYDYTYDWIYSNHDILEVTSVDTSTGEITTGDVWFAERQNFNGVWLPKIPEDVLESYPYACINRRLIIVPSLDTTITMYDLTVSTEPFIFLPKELWRYEYGIDYSGIPDADVYLSGGFGYYFTWTSGDLCWSADFSEPINALYFYGDFVLSYDEGSYDFTMQYENFWLNQNSFETVTWIDMTTGELGTEPLPERASIGKSLMNSIADEVQRLTGITDQMNATTIAEQLSTVKAGIKVGDFVLPAFPDELLAEYPYAVIITVGTGINYAAHLTKEPNCYVPKDMMSMARDSLFTNSDYVIGTINITKETEWTFSENNSGPTANILMSEWSNHSIYIATSFDEENFTAEVGTELYFSRYRYFNGEMLPEFPDISIRDYPYTAIASFSSNDSNYSNFKYVLCFSATPFGRIEGRLVGEPADEMLYSFGEGYTFLFNANTPGVWTPYRSAAAGTNVLYIGEYSSEEETIINGVYNLLWTSHDIHKWTDINFITGEYTIGDLYFPPLEDIDSDRVSIGYDLFNSMVKHIKRLSNTLGRIDARHALFKLKNVIIF